jgi:hypothetical protein
VFELTRLLLHLPDITLEPTENDSYYTFTTMIKHAQTTREPVIMLEQLLEYCGLPSEDKMSEEDGLHENHEYQDLREAGTPEWFDHMWAFEEEFLTKNFDPDSDEYTNFIDMSEVGWMWIDPLVGSSVVALIEAGAVTITACNGQEGHFERHPLVAFWCEADKLPKILDAVEAAGINIRGVKDSTDTCLVISTEESLSKMRDFALELHKRNVSE